MKDLKFIKVRTSVCEYLIECSSIISIEKVNDKITIFTKNPLRINKNGIDAYGSLSLIEEHREKYWTSFRSWAAIIISILSISGTLVLGILKLTQ